MAAAKTAHKNDFDYAKMDAFIAGVSKSNSKAANYMALRIRAAEMPPPDEFEDAAYGVGFVWRRGSVVITAKSNDCGLFDFHYHMFKRDDIYDERLESHLIWNALWCAYHAVKGYPY